MHYYIIDSVKGGCGKTTVSLLWALRNHPDTGTAKDGDADKGLSCIIDGDLLGSEFESAIYNEPFIGKGTCGSPVDKAAKIYLNDLVNRAAYFKREYISELSFKTIPVGLSGIGNKQKKIPVDVVIASPRREDKNRFQITEGNQYLPIISYDAFKSVSKRLIEEIKKKRKNAEKDKTVTVPKYSNIIFDMPPNSEPYSDTFFDLLLDTKKGVFEKGDKVSLVLVSAINRAHIKANQRWLEYFLSVSTDHRWRLPDELIFIYNNVSKAEDATIIEADGKKTNYSVDEFLKDSAKNCKEEFEKRFKDFSDKLRFFRVDHMDDYARMTASEMKVTDIDLGKIQEM